MDSTTRTIIGVSFLILGLIFLLKLSGIIEAFEEKGAAADAAPAKAKACNEITDCKECVQVQGCSFCQKAGKCVRFENKVETVDGVSKVVEPKDPRVEGCSVQNALTSPSQCEAATSGARRLPPMTDSEVTLANLAAAQDNTVGGSGVQQAVQAPTDTSAPVSPPTTYEVVTAPGVARPVGSTSVRPSYPAAVSLDDVSGGPFEKYVQMLVRSELSAQGQPLNTESFVAKEEGAIENATGYVQSAWKGIFGKKKDVRIA